MSHGCHILKIKENNIMVKFIWNKLHFIMKSGRLNKIVRISGLK